MTFSNPVEQKLNQIRKQVSDADTALDNGKAFDLSSIEGILSEVQSEAKLLATEDRNYIAQQLNDLGVTLTDLEDKIKSKNNELTNSINSLGSDDNT